MRVAALWICGKNFSLYDALAWAKYDKEICVVDDSATSANDTYELLALGVTDEYGIYHCQCLSWADFAEAIMRGSGEAVFASKRVSSADWKEMHPEDYIKPTHIPLWKMLI